MCIQWNEETQLPLKLFHHFCVLPYNLFKLSPPSSLPSPSLPSSLSPLPYFLSLLLLHSSLSPPPYFLSLLPLHSSLTFPSFPPSLPLISLCLSSPSLPSFPLPLLVSFCLSYVAMTSLGRSEIYDGILFPVKNWATSLEKWLQLCSSRWYVSGLLI